MKKPLMLLTTKEAARVLDLVPHSIRVLRKSGKLNPAAVSATGVALYDRAELDRYQSTRPARRK